MSNSKGGYPAGPKPDGGVPPVPEGMRVGRSHSTEKIVYGDAQFTYVYNPVTRSNEIRIDRADQHILIAKTIIQEAFDQPNEMLWGTVLLDYPDGAQNLLIINGRNRQVQYRIGDPHDEYTWRAELVLDSQIELAGDGS